LDKRDIPGFLLALEDYTGQRQTVIAAKLLMLTSVRPREICEALWSEFDVEEREWRIPAARMKMRVQHIVPLSRQVLALLVELRQITGDGKFLFPSQGTRAGAIPTATLRNVIRRMGWSDKVSPHGFRGTFSTFMNELGYRPDVIERQLAHSERNKVRAAYHHAEYLPERRKMLQDWADKLDVMKEGAKVIPLHGKAA
jgi:integrase